MKIEEKKNVTIMTGSMEEIDEYKAKHDLKEGGGICALSANIPDDGYYKEKIKQLEKEKADLERELRQVRADLFNAAEVCSERADRIRKLEAALIEAAIK